jgi:hypothetical protein
MKKALAIVFHDTQRVILSQQCDYESLGVILGLYGETPFIGIKYDAFEDLLTAFDIKRYPVPKTHYSDGKEKRVNHDITDLINGEGVLVRNYEFTESDSQPLEINAEENGAGLISFELKMPIINEDGSDGFYMEKYSHYGRYTVMWECG